MGPVELGRTGDPQPPQRRGHGVRRRSVVALCALTLLAAAACTWTGRHEPAPSHAADPPPPPIGGKVNVGGFSLAYRCQGFGSPTVILEAGLGLGGLEEFRSLMPEVASMTRVCTYDRAGVGNSDPRPSSMSPVSGAEFARETHLLFEGIGIDGPYILVGHSFGGMLVRAQAATYPGDAMGLVLIDAASEPEVAYFRRIGINPWVDGTSRIDISSVVTLLERGPALRRTPLVVITAGREDDQWLRQIPARDAAFQDRLAGLSRNAVHVTATDAGHFVQDDDPALVVAAIREALDAARNGTRLPTCSDVFTPLGGACP
jgi:pimeloyl-ACP methyl ester carboxylesterase